MAIPILVYHEISNSDNPWCVRPDKFKEQMRFLKENGYETITLEEIDGATKKSVVITFDDGRKGVKENAYPILKEFGFKAVLYIVADWASGKQIQEKERYSEFLTWSEIKELDGFQFGSHTKTHKSLVDMTEEEITVEMLKSKEEIEVKLEKKVTTFSYPFGRYNEKVENIAKDIFRTIVTMNNGLGEDLKRLARKNVTNEVEFDKLLRPTISLCMITKNEENNLGRCLESVKNQVDEIIIVDTGSLDKTKDIAREYQAKVFNFAWDDDFAKARNESLKRASGDWILILDADEVLEGNVKDLIHSNVDGYSFVTKNLTNNNSIAGFKAENHGEFRGWFPSKKVRMFRNRTEIFFEGKIHEIVDNRIIAIGGQVDKGNCYVIHYGASEGKKEKYLELGREKAMEEGTAMAYVELGIQSKELSRFDDAINSFSRAIELDSNMAVAYYNRGIVFSKIGKEEKALDDYDKALSINNKFSDAYFAKGVVHLKKGFLKKATIDFNNAIKFNKKNSAALLNLGVVFSKMGEFEKAIVVIVRSLTMDGKNPKAFHNLGIAFATLGKYEKAKIAFEEAKRLGYDKLRIDEMIKDLENKEKGNISYGLSGNVE